MKKAEKSASPLFTEAIGFQLLQNLPQGIMVADRYSSTFVYTNQWIQELLGYTAEELLGKSPSFIHPEDEMDRVMLSFQAMLMGEMQAVNNIRFKTKGGEIVLCDIRAQLLQTDNGTYICGFFTKPESVEHKVKESDEAALLQQRLNAAQEVGNMGFWTLYHHNNLLEWSDQAYKIFGYKPRSFQPSLAQFFDIVYEADRGEVSQAYNDHLTNRSPYDIIHRVKTPTGEIRYLRERCVTSFDSEDKPIYSFGTVQDVTALEESRREAVKSLERLHEILANSRSFFWELDAQGKFISLSPNVADIMGYEATEMMKQSSLEYLQATHISLDNAKSFLQNPVKDEVRNRYIPVVRKDGKHIWLNISAKISRKEDGSLLGFKGSATEITEQKLAEDQLIASETKFRTIAETMPGAIWLGDLNFKMYYVSPGVTKLLGISQEAFLNQSRSERYPPHALKQIEAYIQKQKKWLESGKWSEIDNVGLEVETKTLNGEIKWVQIVTTPMFDLEGKPTGFLGVVTDITDLMQREEMLSRLNRILEEGGRLAKMGTWELDLESNNLVWGKITRELHEVADDFQPLLENALEFYQPEYRELLTRKVTEISTKGGTYDLELQIKTAKGNIKWVRTMGHADLDNGKCVRLWGVIQDIDDAKRKSLELLLERSRLDNVISATKVATWYWNVQTGETIFNERWAEMIGHKLADFEPTTIQTWETLCHPDDLAIAEKKLDAYFTGKSPLYETEFRMKHKDGHWVWIRDVGSVVEWTADGKPLAMYGTHEDISVAVQARADLQLAEEKYKIIAENNFNWEFWQGLDGNYLYHSPSVERITGYKVEELFSTAHILQLIHPEDRKNYQEHHVDVACGQKAGEISFRIIDKAGKIHYIDHVCQPIKNSKGEPMGIRGTNIDVTERQEAQIELRKLLKAVEQSKASIVITNLAGQIEYVNPFFTQLTGYSSEEAIGNNPRILSTGHTQSDEYKHMFAKLQKGETWQGEFLNRKKNGELFWEYATISPVRNEAGVISNYVAIKEDITERKKMSETLRASELKYRLIAENTSDVIWVFNFNQNRFTYVSPSVLQLRGFTPEEALEQSIESTMGEEARKKYVDGLYPRILNLIKGEHTEIEPMVVEIRQPHKAGHWIWAEVSMQFHKNELGEVEAIGVSRDIQERKKAEELREKIQAELLQSEARFKTLFYDNASVMYLVDTKTGTFVDANHAALNFYGYSKEEMLSKSITDVNVDIQNWKSKVSYLKSHGIGRFEFRHLLANGDMVDVELFSCLIKINGQSLIHEIVHDISDKNKYLREVEWQNNVLKEIAWTQSHVVRAPLARIMSLIELIDTEHASIYSEPLLLESLKSSARELDELVHQITQKTLEIKPIN